MSHVKDEDAHPGCGAASPSRRNGDGLTGGDGDAPLPPPPSGSPRPPEPTPTLGDLFADDDDPPRIPPDMAMDGEAPGSSPRPWRTRESTSSADMDTDAKRGESSRSNKPSPASLGPTRIPSLPLAWDEALASFETLETCVYERKDLGASREQDEMMVCDCTYDRDVPVAPCGPDSDCINRAIFIECLSKECRAGRHCRNQRFARKQYAPVDIVLTEKKGYGLRAKEDIPSGSLVYEYIGEVVQEKTFRKRMTQYAQEGIRHFYFMMLQKEEYIDATKKGGIGRFANHSCNPNCEVQKWVVGRRMRMGIFTKRDVLKDEEITFNYNVDRYGHEAQLCFCGEYNCVGTIGGKTQTDIGGMDDLFLDALGILDEVEANGMKGSKKKKARQLDEDFVPVLRPIETPHEATKVAAAMRQSMENPRMMGRLLERVKMTDEQALQRQITRMHGFSLMAMVITDMASERDVVLLALESMKQWHVQFRNKIEDSNIEGPVKALSEGSDEEMAAIAKELLQHWSTLELSYRIPRVSKIASLDADDDKNMTTIAEADAMPSRRHPHIDELANNTSIAFELAPVRPAGPPIIRHRPPPPPPPPRPQPTAVPDRRQLDAIIALAAQTQVATVLPTPPVESSSAATRSESVPSESRKRQKTSHRGPEDEAKKEKRLTKLVGEVVVRSMSKYKEQMEHDTFKRYAKDCTATLVEKEKRSSSYAAHRNPTLSEDKKAKIKAFTKEYAHKVLRHLKAKGKLRTPGTPSEPSSSRRPSQVYPASTSGPSPSTPIATPHLTATPSMASATPDDTPGGSALLDDMFGEDMDMDMDMDIDSPAGSGSHSIGSHSHGSRSLSHASPASAHGYRPSANGGGSVGHSTPAATPLHDLAAMSPPLPHSSLPSLSSSFSSSLPSSLPPPLPQALPPSLPPLQTSPTHKAVALEHAGPFFVARRGPILVDRFEGKSEQRDRE